VSGDDIHVQHDSVAHRVTWFGPDRPVEGGTVYTRSDAIPPVIEEEHETPPS
jgi:hypothetical protein